MDEHDEHDDSAEEAAAYKRGLHDSEVGLLRRQMADVQKRQARIEKILNGNGQVGLVAKVASMHSLMKWAIGVATAVFTAGAIAMFMALMKLSAGEA